MLPRLHHFFILPVLLAAAGPLRAQDCRPPRTALVLSGGGAKGIAHVGVLAAMDSLGIRPDLIVGSSMGAAVGALYASGYSGRELDSLVRAVPLSRLFRTYRPRAPRSLGVLRPLVMWEQGDRRFNLQSASIVESEANALMNAAMLKGNLIARGDFDSLPIPFRAVATDLATGRPVVIGSGDLAQAVRASIAIPLVFAPELRDSQFLADGGLSANIPVAVARAEGAERVIVSDATEHSADSFDGYSPINVADRLIEFLFQQPAESLRAGDVMVRPDVEGFNSLNFSPKRLERLLANGRAAADSSLGGVQCRRAPAAESERQFPRRITGFTAGTANDSERLALERMLGFGLGDTLDVDLLRSRVRGLGTSDAYNSVWLGPHGAGDSVGFDLSIRRASRRVVAIGLGYDNELGGRMWAGAVDRRVFGLALEGSAVLFLDAFRKELYTGFRRKFQIARQLMDPTLTLRLATEDVRRFDADGDELDELKTDEALGFAGVERVFPHGWEVALGLHGHVWGEPARDLSTLGIAARAIRVSRTRGRVVRAEGVWSGAYQRARVEVELLGQFGVVRFTPRVMLGWGDNLPIQLAFPLGGDDGFPGLHLGERRGDREAMLGLMFTVPLKGPLLGRVEFAGGRTADGGPLLGDDGWVGGIRAGIGADTPVGEVRFEYGYSTEDRGAVFVRLGDWP
jgi:predicted acylesterase/phospholipase RssA